MENHGFTAGGNQPYWYKILSQLKQRCNNENHPQYKNYGGRGIDYDPRYDASPQAFYDDVGDRPSPKHTIARKDNNKGYWPENMRWATQKEQQRNKRTNRIVKVKGKKAAALAQVAEDGGISRKRYRERLEAGLSPEEALSRPIEGGTLFFTWKGESHNLRQWAKKFKVPYGTLHYWLCTQKKLVEQVFGQLAKGEWPGNGKPPSGWKKEKS